MKRFSTGSFSLTNEGYGANGEGRTPIPLREPDPKSGASANSATFAWGRFFLDYIAPCGARIRVELLHTLWGGQFCPQPAFSRLCPPGKAPAAKICRPTSKLTDYRVAGARRDHARYRTPTHPAPSRGTWPPSPPAQDSR